MAGDVITFNRQHRDRPRFPRDDKPPRDEHPIFEKLRRLAQVNPVRVGLLEYLVDRSLADFCHGPRPRSMR